MQGWPAHLFSASSERLSSSMDSSWRFSDCRALSCPCSEELSASLSARSLLSRSAASLATRCSCDQQCMAGHDQGVGWGGQECNMHYAGMEWDVWPL